MKDEIEAVEYLPQHSRPEHLLEALHRENALAWALVWRICGLAIALALMAGLAMGVLIMTLY